MAAFTGELIVTHEGRELILRLTPLGLARLQDKHGLTVAGLLDPDRDKHAPVPLRVMLDAVSVSLQKGMRMEPDEADELADEILAGDMETFGRLMATAFPDAPEKGRSARGKSTGKGRAGR